MFVRYKVNIKSKYISDAALWQQAIYRCQTVAYSCFGYDFSVLICLFFSTNSIYLIIFILASKYIGRKEKINKYKELLLMSILKYLYELYYSCIFLEQSIFLPIKKRSLSEQCYYSNHPTYLQHLRYNSNNIFPKN